MEKFFNTSGPIKPEDHYAIPPLQRVDWDEIQHLIASERYFVLHAPRQTGKTSALLAMMATLNAQGRFACAYANIEGAQAARGDETQGIPAACDALVDAIELYLANRELKSWYKAEKASIAPQHLLTSVLQQWAQTASTPVVLLLDEVDALVGDSLISLLRQIRAGYAQRPRAFPQSLVLCGVRDVRDYRMRSGDQEVITGGSAFNIKAVSLLLRNFSADETRALWLQHTAATGQVFADAIFPELWEDTAGQPWLVNALGNEVTWNDRAARDRTRSIGLEDYRAGRERLIQSRATHLDQLADKLKEERERSVISPFLQGAPDAEMNPDNVDYLVDLGLLRREPNGRLTLANAIYREIIPRELSWGSQMGIEQEQSWYLTPERRLDMSKLLAAFQQFFRENGDSWVERFDYKEAGPQLLMQAFLQRIINGGGRIGREYALGRRRTDLFIEWPSDAARGFHGPVQKIVIELKLKYPGQGLANTLARGLEQTADYADRVGADEAHLVIFDRDPSLAWDDKVWRRPEFCGKRAILVWGC